MPGTSTTAPHAGKRDTRARGGVGLGDDGRSRGLAHTDTTWGPWSKGGSFPLIATVCLGVLPLNTSSTAAAAAASVGCDSFSAGYRYGMVWYGMVGSAPAKSYVLKKNRKSLLQY